MHKIFWEQIIPAISSDSDPFPQQLRRRCVFTHTSRMCQMFNYSRPQTTSGNSFLGCKTVILAQLCALLRVFSDRGQKSEPSESA